MNRGQAIQLSRTEPCAGTEMTTAEIPFTMEWMLLVTEETKGSHIVGCVVLFHFKTPWTLQNSS